jgi:uncharacterized membrane protein
MLRSPLLLFHIATAAIGLLSGFTALLLGKGSRGHRTFGNVFFVSMLSMSASATYLAIMKPAMISIVPGIFTFYLVATAWATVIRKPGECGIFEYGALLATLGAGIYGFVLGWGPAHSATGLDKNGFPAAIRKTGLLNVPAMVVVVLMIFWMIRVRFANRFGHGEFGTRSRRSVQAQTTPASIAAEK